MNTLSRQIVLDTETTGLEPSRGHRIIEIGCVELVDRRLTGNDFHQYLQPDREIDAAAVEVHGITNEFLADKPRFEDVVQDFMDYVQGAELIIHNAPFDVGFIDAELERVGGWNRLDSYCRITDTLVMARNKHPGQRNSLDALCGRYDIDNSQRQKHGALLDAEILAEVYLAMTGGQSVLFQEEQGGDEGHGQGQAIRRLAADRGSLRVVRATDQEVLEHQRFLQEMGDSLWMKQT
ncbi:DNA polymerase III subunit epsilon [Thiolapillus brandeum]|uniref:DNA polymerase III subunit epsilon n=1 Tax=Thiolapillus brandeum TaxID=1076588 RepID=A0A7U6GHE6_9GAMM|nr:DNA polymerase III subunit epsilon [Thiolapillus brandeum]BAO43714.1 DNA polymerase III epsilon subunit [Thiolapillus brandeum]